MKELSIAEVLAEVAVLVKPHFGKGRPADYIPSLAEVPGTKFGMAVRTVAGEEHVIGDADEGFSVQSITKVFALVRDFAGFLAGEAVEIDATVAASELSAAWQNRAIASLMRGQQTITHDPETVVAAYSRQCALTMSCRQLARAFLPLAAGGFSPVAQETIFHERLTRRLNALLLTCGIYDSVGNFAYRVGLPAKSGVGGGIVAVIPGKATVAVWSPELDRYGTSVVGTAALEAFSQITNCSVL
jgi:glutaminase